MIVLLSVIGLVANEDLIVYKVDNSDGKITPKSIEESLTKSGFSVQENRDMNGPFKIQFKETTFDTYNLMVAYHKELAPKLVIEHPRNGMFVPFSIAIYKKKGDKFLHVSFLSAKGMSKITGQSKVLYKSLEEATRKAFLKALPKAEIEKLAYEPQATDKKLYTEFSLESEDDEALETKEDLEMEIEGGLKPIGFVMASFNEFGVDLEKVKNDDYIFFDAYSLCKLKVIYNIAITRPEAGAFAPCTMVIYQKKGEGKMTIVFPNVYNWVSTLALKDKKLIDILYQAQGAIEELLSSATE